MGAFSRKKLHLLVPISIKKWPHLAGFPLADPDFAMPGDIDLLISAQITGYLLLDASRKWSLD